MGQTIAEKICQAHLAEGPARPLRAGDFISLRPRHVLTHDNTAAVMKKFRSIGASRIHDPRQPVFALDHDIQNDARENLDKYRAIEAFASEQGVDFYPAGRGIGHQIMVEQGYVVPGSLVVASDSHSNMYGAVGALGTPVVRTDAAALWATGEFWWQIPRTVQVVLEGRLMGGATGKDVILALCAIYNREEVLNAVVEFTGPGIAGLSMDERLTIANMSTEWGALAGWFPVDRVTLRYLEERHAVLAAAGVERFTRDDLRRWAQAPPAPDPQADYFARITLDLSVVTPQLTGPDTVQVATPVAEATPREVAIQRAYLLSCVNSRLSDLEAAAAVLRGRKVAPGVRMYVAAASSEVQAAAMRSGAWAALVEAGAIPLSPGCGPCIGLGVGLLEPGEVGISATNRNFKGRMGSREAQCYLASPSVVAASAAAGYICAPASAAAVARPLERRYVERAPSSAQSLAALAPGEAVEILEGFPARLRGRLVLVTQDNLNTDGIYGKDYTYREDMTPEMMAAVVMENYDPGFAGNVQKGDLVVGGFNFGTGSSREQAVTALQAKGIPAVVAGSFSQTYLRNAFNNGYLCIEIPALVRRMREALGAGAKACKTLIPGDELTIDFTTATATWRGELFPFAPLGSVPQALVAAGGIEELTALKLRAPRR